jgi:hypothetical protein
MAFCLLGIPSWTAKNAVQFNKKRQAFSCWFCSLGFHFSLAQAFTPGNVGEPTPVPFSFSPPTREAKMKKEHIVKDFYPQA